jgi:hypothetical protein
LFDFAKRTLIEAREAEANKNVTFLHAFAVDASKRKYVGN